MNVPRRVDRWTVFFDRDGDFGHARHDDPDVLIAWTIDELASVDSEAARTVQRTLRVGEAR